MTTSTIYTPQQLLARVRQLDEHLPISGQIAPPRAYTSHKHHWIGWLKEYDTPGFYRRKYRCEDARAVYMRVQNVGMVIWLAEAATVEIGRVRQAAMIAANTRGNVAQQTAAARRLLPWIPVYKGLWP